MTYASDRGTPLTLIMCLCSCLAAQGAAARERDTAARTFGNDVFMAGSNVGLTDGSRGDAILAGAWVSTLGAVQGDEVATGGQVKLGANVDGTLYAAGGHVQLDGKVARNARIAGGHVEIGPEADVQGGLTIGGGEVAEAANDRSEHLRRKLAQQLLRRCVPRSRCSYRFDHRISGGGPLITSRTSIGMFNGFPPGPGAAEARAAMAYACSGDSTFTIQ